MLTEFWSYCADHAVSARDGIVLVSGLKPEDIDAIVDVKGFGDSLLECGFLSEFSERQIRISTDYVSFQEPKTD